MAGNIFIRLSGHGTRVWVYLMALDCDSQLERVASQGTLGKDVWSHFWMSELGSGGASGM